MLHKQTCVNHDKGNDPLAVEYERLEFKMILSNFISNSGLITKLDQSF